MQGLCPAQCRGSGTSPGTARLRKKRPEELSWITHGSISATTCERLAIGGIYALVALGYTMVYGVLKLINFAHGDLFTIGAYLGMTLFVSLGLAGKVPAWAAVTLVAVMVMGLVALLGWLLERAAYRPLRSAGRLSAVVSALGASIFFQNAVMLIWGAKYYVYPETMRPDTILHLFGMGIPAIRIVIIAASVLLMLALYWFINRTRLGTAIRAAAIDQGAARLMGINVDRHHRAGLSHRSRAGRCGRRDGRPDLRADIL